MRELPTYVLERTFKAPRELVWKTWTDPELLARWYGPNVETVIHELNVRPGGLWLNEMKMGGNSGYQRTEYVEVDEPSKLVCLMASTNDKWEVTANPMMPDWPRVLLTTVTFEEVGNETVMKLTWVPHEATDAEITCFAGAISGADKGWAAGMAILEELLAELQQAA
ncbi:SRPBCC family protein [Roseibium sediminis]|uniref:SRPBCC family protein n=1 Tax=Roseibium sediminis TaxID=1775174 RepID=UPI00123DFE33|nr:SRPBCC domain-containing protein [Roseibium sediminis]